MNARIQSRFHWKAERPDAYHRTWLRVGVPYRYTGGKSRLFTEMMQDCTGMKPWCAGIFSQQRNDVTDSCITHHSIRQTCRKMIVRIIRQSSALSMQRTVWMTLTWCTTTSTRPAVTWPVESQRASVSSACSTWCQCPDYQPRISCSYSSK